MAVQSDYDLLVEMGFDPERVKMAVSKTKGRKHSVSVYTI